MIPTPQTPTQTAHPEISPGVWTWTAASHPTPSHPIPPHPAPSLSPKLAIAYFLFLALGSGAVGFTVWSAGVAAGESGSAAKIQQLETTAAATDARIDAFCEVR